MASAVGLILVAGDGLLQLGPKIAVVARSVRAGRRGGPVPW